MIHSGHTGILVSIAIIRTRPEYVPRSTISSIAIFTAMRFGRREARFAIDQVFFDTDHARAEIIAGLVQRIPRSAELLVRQPRPSAHQLQYARSNIGPMPPSDLTLIARELTGCTILPVHVSDGQLAAMGESLGLDMPVRPSTPIRLWRRAPLMAQALWASYVGAFCPAPERRALFAAHGAWLAIEKARDGERSGRVLRRPPRSD